MKFTICSCTTCSSVPGIKFHMSTPHILMVSDTLYTNPRISSCDYSFKVIYAGCLFVWHYNCCFSAGSDCPYPNVLSQSSEIRSSGSCQNTKYINIFSRMILDDSGLGKSKESLYVCYLNDNLSLEAPFFLCDSRIVSLSHWFSKESIWHVRKYWIKSMELPLKSVHMYSNFQNGTHTLQI